MRPCGRPHLPQPKHAQLRHAGAVLSSIPPMGDSGVRRGQPSSPSPRGRCSARLGPRSAALLEILATAAPDRRASIEYAQIALHVTSRTYGAISWGSDQEQSRAQGVQPAQQAVGARGAVPAPTRRRAEVQASASPHRSPASNCNAARCSWCRVGLRERFLEAAAPKRKQATPQGATPRRSASELTGATRKHRSSSRRRAAGGRPPDQAAQ